MSDRCYLILTMLAKDTHHLTGLRELDDNDHYRAPLDSSGLVSVEYDEVNCGAYNDLVELAENLVPFEGSHSAGGNYGPHDFVSDGSGGYLEVSTNHQGAVVVPLDLATLKPSREHIAGARAYRNAMDAFTIWKDQLESDEN